MNNRVNNNILKYALAMDGNTVWLYDLCQHGFEGSKISLFSHILLIYPHKHAPLLRGILHFSRDMKTLSALLDFCEGSQKSPMNLHHKEPMVRRFVVFILQVWTTIEHTVELPVIWYPWCPCDVTVTQTSQNWLVNMSISIFVFSHSVCVCACSSGMCCSFCIHVLYSSGCFARWSYDCKLNKPERYG